MFLSRKWILFSNVFQVVHNLCYRGISIIYVSRAFWRQRVTKHGFISVQAAMDLKTLAEASDKAAAFFESQLDENGRLKSDEVVGELAAIYKLPTLLILTGRGRLAHKVCCVLLAAIMLCT